MTETVQRDLLAKQLVESEAELRRLAAAPGDALQRSYAPGKWNGIQIINHIADADLNLLARFLKAIAEDGTPILAFDENLWTAELRNNERPIALSLALVASVRELFRYYLKTLPDSALQRTAIHPVAGPQQAWQFARIAAEHCAHHMEQVRAIVENREWHPQTR